MREPGIDFQILPKQLPLQLQPPSWSKQVTTSTKNYLTALPRINDAVQWLRVKWKHQKRKTIACIFHPVCVLNLFWCRELCTGMLWAILHQTVRHHLCSPQAEGDKGNDGASCSVHAVTNNDLIIQIIPLTIIPKLSSLHMKICSHIWKFNVFCTHLHD